jgi:hypothetical protein
MLLDFFMLNKEEFTALSAFRLLLKSSKNLLSTLCILSIKANHSKEWDAEVPAYVFEE